MPLILGLGIIGLKIVTIVAFVCLTLKEHPFMAILMLFIAFGTSFEWQEK